MPGRRPNFDFLPKLTQKLASTLSPHRRRKDQKPDRRENLIEKGEYNNNPTRDGDGDGDTSKSRADSDNYSDNDNNKRKNNNNTQYINQPPSAPTRPRHDSAHEPPFLTDSDTTHKPATMADGEPDYSSLPLTDRWVHKVRRFFYFFSLFSFWFNPLQSRE